MVKSMTGYGRACASFEKEDITIEIRAVNHRYLDCNIKVPKLCGFLEEPIKQVLQESVFRGKVDVYVTIEQKNGENVSIALNKSVLESFIEIAGHIKDEYGLKGELSVENAIRLPEVFSITNEDEDMEVLKSNVISTFKEAVKSFVAMRDIEGEKLAYDILSRCEKIKTITEEINKRSPQIVADYRKRLEQKIAEVLSTQDIDNQRILTEAAIFADKVAVSEETVRLESHLSQISKMLKSGGTVGRKLDFIVQELNREANTIGSKCNDLSTTEMVIEIKSEIEKIREQVQNIE